jgi:predicted DNA-binding transcriptional regulator AlpA
MTATIVMSDLLTTADVAALAGVKPKTLRTYVLRGSIPAPGRIGRTLVWPPDVIERWLAGRPGRGRPRRQR